MWQRVKEALTGPMHAGYEYPHRHVVRRMYVIDAEEGLPDTMTCLRCNERVEVRWSW